MKTESKKPLSYEDIFVDSDRLSGRRATVITEGWDLIASAFLPYLFSTHRRQLDVPRYRRTTLGRRAFSVAGPTVWNSLPDELREETENTFRLSVKTSLFRQH